MYELWAQAYPRELVPPATWASLPNLGQYDKALEAFARSLAPRSGYALTYSNLVHQFPIIWPNRLKEARTPPQRRRQRISIPPYLHLYLYELGFLQHDAARMAQQAVWATGQPGQ